MWVSLAEVGQPHGGATPRRWKMVEPSQLRVGQLVRFEAPRFEPDGGCRLVEVISAIASVVVSPDGAQVCTQSKIVCRLAPGEKIAVAM